MSAGKQKRSFRLSPEQEQFVEGAKVQTDTDLYKTAQRSTIPGSMPLHQVHGKSAVLPPLPPTYFAQYSTEQRKIPAHPWDTSFGKSTYNFTFSPEQYAKALWCSAHIPGGASLAELLRMGLEMVCADLIQKHYKPEK